MKSDLGRASAGFDACVIGLAFHRREAFFDDYLPQHYLGRFVLAQAFEITFSSIIVASMSFAPKCRPRCSSASPTAS
jgi:hypothetical protein